MERVGIKPISFESFSKLKAEFLFFDKILINEEDVQEYLSKWYNFSIKTNNFSLQTEITRIDTDLDFLINKGLIITDYNVAPQENIQSTLQDQKFNVSEIESMLWKTIINKAFGNFYDNKKYDEEKFTHYMEGFNIYLNTRAREQSEKLLSANPNNEFIPLITDLELRKEVTKTKKEEVIKIVLQKFPIPNDQTSWEQILDFKLDHDVTQKFKRLKSWINKISYSTFSPLEIEEEIESLISEYDNYMKLNQKKFNRGNLELFIIPTLEIIENIIKFKINWSKIAKCILDIQKSHLDIRIAEANAPGKELAFLVKAQKEFS